MKALIILALLITLGSIFFRYSKDKKLNKLLLSLATFGFIVTLAVIGNLTRPIFPLFMAHIILVLIAWGALMVYTVKEKYYWWIIFSPVITIGLFFLLEFLGGSAHEI